MAESQAVAKQALKKLEDQLTCAICLDAFKDPKLLQCFHVYCKDCLEQLVVQDRQGQFSLCCPTCQQSTLLPPDTNISDLQPAFYIHHLFEIQDTLKKVKEPHKVQCEKCRTPRPATSYCHDCGEFICAICTTVHSDWDVFVKHEVVVLEQLESKVKELAALKKVTLYCSLHQGKELDLFCETCGELICLHCTVNKHYRPEHKYDLVSDTFERHKAEIIASLEPVENHLSVVSKMLEQLDVRCQELSKQRTVVEADIQQQIQQLHEVLEMRKAELISQLDQQIQIKMENLAAQKNEVKTVQTQLVSCLAFVKDSLRTGSLGEVMKMKKAVIRQIKDMTDKFKSDLLHPCEPPNVKFKASPQDCQQFGQVFLQQTSPEKCYATGKGLEVAEPSKRATAVLHVVDHEGKVCTTPMESLTCEVVSSEKIDCSVKKTEASQYEISYQPTIRGRHQLHIKVEGEHIKGSPFTVTVKLPVQKLGTPIKTITGVKNPRGVAVNQRGDIIVAESAKHCISIFLPTGEKLQSFSSQGYPWGVAVDDDGNILVVDAHNSRIQKFTTDGKFITVVGKGGSQYLEFNLTRGIAIHPYNKKIYIADNGNHRIQILNPDLTFSSSFGSKGSDNGQFQSPLDVAFDNTGNVYVADLNNYRIQVFTAEGTYLRKFGKSGRGSGELSKPTSISIDGENVVYVTEYGNHRVSVLTCEGRFLTSFGSKGSGPGQFNEPQGIAVDRSGMVYVSDTSNNCLQLF